MFSLVCVCIWKFYFAICFDIFTVRDTKTFSLSLFLFLSYKKWFATWWLFKFMYRKLNIFIAFIYFITIDDG